MTKRYVFRSLIIVIGLFFGMETFKSMTALLLSMFVYVGETSTPLAADPYLKTLAISTYVLDLVSAVVFLVFSRQIASLFFRSEPVQQTVVTVTKKDLYELVLAGIGIFLIAHAVPDVTRGITEYYQFRWKTTIVSVLPGVVAGIACLMGAVICATRRPQDGAPSNGTPPSGGQ